MQTRGPDAPTVFLATAGLYVVVLLAVVGYGALAFGDLYFETPPRPVDDEDAAIRIYELQYRDAYQDYRAFLLPAGVTLALYLGIWCAAFGVWKRRYWMGIAALAVGGGITVLGLSLLPSVYFPIDRYAVPALWIMGSILPVAVSWALVTVLGRTLMPRPA